MKLYESIGPNPRVVKMFIAEKGLQIPRQQVDLPAGENRREPFTNLNPSGQTPALEIEEGLILAEITAICEYLEELYPDPPLIGTTAMQRAETRMWVRRIDLNILEPMANGFRYGEGLRMFENRVRCLPEASQGLKTIAREKLEWLDDKIAGRQWIVGDRFTLADIMLFAFLEFGAQVGQPLDAKNANLAAWYERAKARPSVKAAA
ncbi:MAG TPA: glutathione S-transferase family protein [Caulobacteraceae bacterium]|jgi:glutathione S-transferase|nr:glutathione S-transferase family protein [Caulobacteraceae bacterium]